MSANNEGEVTIGGGRLEREPSRREKISYFARGVTARYLASNEERPPDVGFAWLVAFASFVVHFVVLGIVYTFGVWLKPLQEEFNATSSAVSWVAGLNLFVFLLGNIPVGRLVDRFGFRLPLIAGIVMYTVGLLLSSSTTAIWQLFISHGLLNGFAAALCFLPAVTAVGSWFQKRRGIGVGLAVAGSAVGNFALAPILEALRAAYGWRRAMRIAAIVFCALLLVIAPIMKRRVPLKRDAVRTRREFLYTRRFYFFWSALCLVGYGYYAPFVHVINHAVVIGVDRSRAVWLVSGLGAGSVAGRIFFGLLSDRIGPLFVLRISLAIMAVCNAALGYLPDIGWLVAYACLYGFCAGSVPAMVPPTTSVLFGEARYSEIAGAFYSAFGIGNFLGPPLVAYLFEELGDYKLGFWTCAISLVCAIIIHLFVQKPSEEALAALTKPTMPTLAVPLPSTAAAQTVTEKIELPSHQLHVARAHASARKRREITRHKRNSVPSHRRRSSRRVNKF